MAEINKFKNYSDEEIEALIKERQKRFPKKEKLTTSQLAEGISPKEETSNYLRYVLNVLSFLLVFPYVVKLIKEIDKYKQYASIIRRVINTNDKFFDFLEKYKFYPVRFTRLMSIQPIPEQLIELSDEELFAITTRSLLPIKKIVEETRLLEILTIKISNRKINEYAILLEPKNFYECCYLVKMIIFSILFYILLFTLYIFM